MKRECLKRSELNTTVIVVFLCASFAGCGGLFFTAPDSTHSIDDFEVAWAWADSVYPAFDIKHVDWNDVYEEFRPRAEQALGDEMFQVLNDMLALVADPHVYYSSRGGSRFYPYKSLRLLSGKNSFSSTLVRTYFDGELHITAEDGVEYGVVDGTIGYIHITHFNKDGMMDDFPSVMAFVSHTDGLIVDVRNNTGGDHDKVEVVVREFIDSTMAWPLGVEADGATFAPWPDITPIPGQAPYINPVVVLINGASLSSGELFPEVMKRLPNVTLVGDTTAGAGCNTRQVSPGDRVLPSGKLIHIPTGCLLRHDGVPWELIGITPDIRVEQTEEDVLAGVDRQLEFAIEMLR